MKSIKLLLAVVAIMFGTAAAQAGGPIKFGPKVGLTVNKLHFNQDVLNSDNQTGWTAGAMLEATVPIIGIGADLSVMYVRRNAEFMVANNIKDDNRDYIEIPLNLKYKFNLPVVSKFLVPYIGVGPSVSFLTSRKNIENAYKNKSVDWAMNFGVGVQLMSHLDINARYGLGLTKAVNTFSSATESAGIEGKNRYWTITLGYLF
ncbi:MAG: porin family protein [Duncaniella sp.]|nr:porin family protein [Duncaniella sp.]MDE6327354.1 porin family protein [Duncaniella sp.]